MDSGAPVPAARSSSSHRLSSAAASSSSAAPLLPGSAAAPDQLDGLVYDGGHGGEGAVPRRGEEDRLDESFC